MNMKKLFLLNLPYLLFVYPFDKLAQAFRLAPGADLSSKLLSIEVCQRDKVAMIDFLKILFFITSESRFGNTRQL